METLGAMSAATAHLSPGAAAALVDWEGSEPARLRAFGVVHGVVLREVNAHGRSRLLAQLTDTAQLADAVTPGNAGGAASARPSAEPTGDSCAEAA
jgi:hypothetical protein